MTHSLFFIFRGPSWGDEERAEELRKKKPKGLELEIIPAIVPYTNYLPRGYDFYLVGLSQLYVPSCEEGTLEDIRSSNPNVAVYGIDDPDNKLVREPKKELYDKIWGPEIMDDPSELFEEIGEKIREFGERER